VLFCGWDEEALREIIVSVCSMFVGLFNGISDDLNEY
jgi:hypothetical protein